MVPSPLPDGQWLGLAAALARRAVGGRLAVAALPIPDRRARMPLVARYDGDQPVLSRRTLVRALRRVALQPWYIESLRPADALLPGSREARRALAVVRLPIGETPGFLMVLGNPGQRFDGADLFRLEEVAQAIVTGLGQAGQALAAERRRIERLLHDTFAATLTGLLFNLGRLVRADLSFPEQELAERASADVRTALRQLRGVLDSVGSGPEGAPASGRLGDLLKELADDGVEVCSNVDGSLASSLSAELLACIYEVAREALVNVRRHAGASRVELSLTRDGRTITFRLWDDGRGCPGAGGDAAWGGHGLRLMRERVAEIGGELSFHTGGGAGTQIVASFSAPE